MSTRLRTAWRRRPLLRESGVAVATGVCTMGLAYRMSGMHRGDFGIPSMGGDGLLVYSLVKGMQQHGWYTPNPSLGFPVGQDLAPYPNLDLLHLLALKVLSVVTANPYAPVRLFYFWSFLVIAVLMYVLLRYAGTRILIAVPLAVSVSVAPWHFQRMIGHVFLTNYASIIVGLLVGLVVLRRIRTARDDPGALSRRRLAIDAIGLVAAGFAIAGGGLYWAFVAGCVIGLTTLPALVTSPTRRGALYAALALVPTPIFAAAWLKYQSASSSLPVVVRSFQRQFIESELYGGSISALVLPSPRSGIRRIAEIRADYDKVTGIGANLESGPWNSFIGVLAVTVASLLVLSVFLTLWRNASDGGQGRWRRLPELVDSARQDGWLGSFLVVFAMYAVTALGSLAMLLLFQEIRAWARFFVPLVIIATVVLGITLTRASRWRDGLAVPVAIAVVLVLMLYADQVRGNYREDFVTYAATAADAKAFDEAVEASVAPGCGVLTLPVMPFPENGPIGPMPDYDPLWLYLESTDLRFTYGMPKNQPEDGFQAQFMQPLTPQLLDVARDAGVCGISIDTLGYGGPDVPAVQAVWMLTGTTPIWSPSRRWVFVPI